MENLEGYALANAVRSSTPKSTFPDVFISQMTK
ncbi:MAG: hypothetical protein JWQ24_720 [Tardiphaga sp.]|nr:hypothetical protein [Tardiphaga sp.]